MDYFSWKFISNMVGDNRSVLLCRKCYLFRNLLSYDFAGSETAGNNVTDLIIRQRFPLLYHGVPPLLRDRLLPLPGEDVVQDVGWRLALRSGRLYIGELHLESLDLLLESLVVLLQQSLRADLQLQQLLGRL